MVKQSHFFSVTSLVILFYPILYQLLPLFIYVKYVYANLFHGHAMEAEVAGSGIEDLIEVWCTWRGAIYKMWLHSFLFTSVSMGCLRRV